MSVCLAGEASLRSGCGLVTIGVPEGLNDIIEIKLTEVMSLPLPQTEQRTFSDKAIKPVAGFITNNTDAVLIGPGISTERRETRKFVEEIVRNTKKPLVIDADAINIISLNPAVLKKNTNRNIILTPHPGEMSHLTGLTINEIQRKKRKNRRRICQRKQCNRCVKRAPNGSN